ncbi:MAG: fibronectin type III domain-containing protein [Verrucomicrobiales bacterium]|nr:fibronectin type III domain-containing protein [Verrucomicrobiales bacterium]
MSGSIYSMVRCSTLSGAVGTWLALAQSICAQVTIEIVNDSGRPDSSVFLKAPGFRVPGHGDATILPARLFVDLSDPAPADAASAPLSSLAIDGAAPPYPIVSSISGNTNTVYSVQVDFINSGGLYFTYDRPFSFTGSMPSPPPNSAGNAYRYDYAEFTINDTEPWNNAIDVTYVDKFGIPMQIEWFKGNRLVAGSYVYGSTRTLVEAFVASGLGEAVFGLTESNITPGWRYSGPASYTNFARILAPQKVDGTGASVSPYPDVTAYLNSLTGSSNSFQLNGGSPQGGYYYVGYSASLSTNAIGWLVTLAPGANPPPFNGNLIAGIAYTNTITFPIEYSRASQYVYGAPVGPNLYSVNGSQVTDPSSPTYPVETWMIGDVLSALNFGFWGGRYGTNSADWFSPVSWMSLPFGSARQVNDNHYNPYSALVYNYADPYGFAFSERITPDVLLTPGNGDRVRITLLPDDRLDAPVVMAPAPSMISSNSITLNWGQVEGADGYQVNVLRPSNVAAIRMPFNATSCTLSNLVPGTPYVMSVSAVGTGAGGNPILTPARPVSATTTGSAATRAGDLTLIQATFSAADPYYQLAKVYINGTELSPVNGQWLANGVPARWIAHAGTNEVAVWVVGGDGGVIFHDWLGFVLEAPFTRTNSTVITTHSAISDVVFHGQKLSQPAPDVSGFLNQTTASNFLISTQGVSLVLGLTYVPAESRRYAPVASHLLGSPISPVRIDQPVRVSGGRMWFSFDVPFGVPYSIEASPDLASWQTIATGFGQVGSQVYSPATSVPSPSNDFFRIHAHLP